MLMVQSNAQPMKTTKIKGPPPVPPRPSQSRVAEALAKTRKAVADSKSNLTKTRTFTKHENHQVSSKAKTLDRYSSSNKPSVSPRQTGLARVKSFIRDVISDRGSSSDEKKSSGQNSRRSSSDSSSINSPSSTKKSNESLNSRAVKTCKQILVRSLSTSNKLDQDAKCKVSKSSSFAEKTLPLRKAPPPPLSPKPKNKPMRSLPVHNTNVNAKKSKIEPEISPYSLPVDAQATQTPISEATYATVDEVSQNDNRIQNCLKVDNLNNTQNSINNSNSPIEAEYVNNNSLESKTSRVTEMLISEILASRNSNKDEPNTVIDKGKSLTADASPDLEIMKDMNNHEMLIYELQTMHSQSNVSEVLDNDIDRNGHSDSDSEQNYAMASVTSENTDDGYEQAYAHIVDDDLKTRLRKQFRAISTMSLHGLPPLPKSLSGFADGEPAPDPPISDGNPPSDLDGQLTYLKKEMASLRQLDLSLLSELWTLSEAMASWRRQLERGTRLRPAPPPPPPPHYLRT